MSDEPLGTGAPQSGSDQPLQGVREELKTLLEADSSLLGEVYRRLQAGETADEIRAARGAERPNFVWSYQRLIRALLEDDLPKSPTVALATARRFRSILRRKALSDATRSELERRLRILEERANDAVERNVEEEEAVAATAQVESQAVPGVYVYALPHYVRHPYEPDSGRTLLKVGRSDSSTVRRFREQTRTTALPEEPVLLRVYPCDGEEALLQERKFHSLLEAADHDRSRARTAGTEWFLTSLKFLDEIAGTLNLRVVEVTALGEILD